MHGPVGLDGRGVSLAVALALVVTVVPGLWTVLRVIVTLVHELGHAVVGMLAGRRFTGFVVRGDMSGHAVTVGPTRGPGRVVTTWAGYPAPAVVGAALVWAAGRGLAAPALTLGILALLVALTRIRSLGTVGVVTVVLAVLAALWWWRDDSTQATGLTATGLVLVVGGWRHLVAVASSGRRNRTSDPAVLATLTWVPRVGWLASFVVVQAAATWLVARELWAAR